MNTGAFPPCACGGPRRWKVCERHDRKHFEFVYLRCINCDCYACLVFHEGGNAFCVPVRGLKDSLPFETVSFVAVDLIEFFQRNVEKLHHLRKVLEKEVLAETYKRFTFWNGIPLSRFRDGVQLAIDRAFWPLFLSDKWFLPPGYDPSPFPDEVPTHTLVYVFKKSHGEDTWFKIKPTYPKLLLPPSAQ